jgi:hypothetical protein
MYVIVDVHEAVFTNPWSGVTEPVVDNNFEMS